MFGRKLWVPSVFVQYSTVMYKYVLYVLYIMYLYRIFFVQDAGRKQCKAWAGIENLLPTLKKRKSFAYAHQSPTATF